MTSAFLEPQRPDAGLEKPRSKKSKSEKSLGEKTNRSIDALQGDLAFWLFAASELFTMALGLVAFAFAKVAQPEAMRILHDALHPQLAFANTLLLLTSGAFIAAAVVREFRDDDAFFLWAAALLLGIAFLVVKGVEFSLMARAGFNLSTGPLVSGYFLLTGFHYLHVGLGVFFIASILWQRWRTQAMNRTDNDLVMKEFQEAKSFGASAAVFWHSLDLMWVVIFAVVYS